MRRHKLFNQYKLKRKWGRGVKHSHSWLHSLLGISQTKKKDFSWQGRKVNPYRTIVPDKDDKKLKIEIAIISLSFLGILALALFSSFFNIDKIEIVGTQRINDAEIESVTLGILDYKLLGFLPKKNYFLADLDEIRDILKDRFPIEYIAVKKTFPDHLQLLIEEKISTIIYDNAQEYSYVDLSGNVVEIMRKVSNFEWQTETKTTTSTNEAGELEVSTEIIKTNHLPDSKSIKRELGDYPLIYDKREKVAVLNNQILEPETVVAVVDWFNALHKRTNITTKYFVIEDEIGNMTIFSNEGWYIKTRIANDINKQIEQILLLLKEKINFNSLNYLDLRYPDRVYWQ